MLTGIIVGDYSSNLDNPPVGQVVITMIINIYICAYEVCVQTPGRRNHTVNHNNLSSNNHP